MADQHFLQFKRHLKKTGHFCTAPRMRLFGVLQNHPNLTIKEIISRVRKHDQATVYRNIALFESLGIITVTKYGWDTRIELTDDYHPHHHHISCTLCGSITPLPHSLQLESEIEKLVVFTNFTPQSHMLEVRGLCHTCQNSMTSS